MVCQRKFGIALKGLEVGLNCCRLFVPAYPANLHWMECKGAIIKMQRGAISSSDQCHPAQWRGGCSEGKLATTANRCWLFLMEAAFFASSFSTRRLDLPCKRIHMEPRSPFIMFPSSDTLQSYKVYHKLMQCNSLEWSLASEATQVLGPKIDWIWSKFSITWTHFHPIACKYNLRQGVKDFIR